jgi:hypothetical protein
MTETRYGYPLVDWVSAKAEAKAVLRERAGSRETITYGELCDAIHAIRMFPRSRALLGMLHDVCSEEDAERGVMLASLVVSKATGMPGEGYFAFADELGRDATDRGTFWRAEVERVYAAYANGGTK